MEYAIYVRQGGYICKGSYSVQREVFIVLSTGIEENTRIFKTRKSAEMALDKMLGKYSNLYDAEVVEVIRQEEQKE